MLQRITPLARTSGRLLCRPAAGFCIFKGYLNPYKHITMNHNPHNTYIDGVDIGEYPEIVEIGSIAPRTYQPIIAQTFIEVVEKYRNQSGPIVFTADYLKENSHRSIEQILFRLNGKIKHNKFRAILPELLNRLADRIIVKESRWTWIVEQKYRLLLSNQRIEYTDASLTPQEFFDKYSQLIDTLVQFSQLGHSKDIHQPQSPLEQHYWSQLQNNEIQEDINTVEIELDQNGVYQDESIRVKRDDKGNLEATVLEGSRKDIDFGIEDLRKDTPENKTFINRLLFALHL